MAKTVVVALLYLAALHAVGAAAQTYRWVDKDGRVHYTDTPPPKSAATTVQQKSGSSSVVETSQVPYAVQQATKSFPVTIYTSENCGDACTAGRALLSQRGVPFREISVADEKSRAELKRVSGGDMVPVITVGRTVTKGFEADMWHTALDAGGYPRSAPPLAAQKSRAAAPPDAKASAPKEAAEDDEASRPRGPYAPR